MGLPTVIGKAVEPVVCGGNIRLHHKVIAGPVSYTTGGDALDARDLSDTWILAALPVPSTDGTRIAYFYTNPATRDMTKSVKMMIVTSATGAEVANASDQSLKEFIVPIFMVG